MYELLGSATTGFLNRMRVRERELKRWLRAILFLIALCLAGMDSADFKVFVLTKVLAVLIILIVYVEGKGSWRQRETASIRDGYMGRPLRGSHVGALQIFERRKSVPCSYSFKRLDRDGKVDLVGRLVFPRTR
ncbi:MAG TPA: hypothetical protein VNN20_16830 [Thermodesulfobacteriota bacterium]|nr:hypothetical protein [Thermodesulfobacteriota bacterium]